MKKKSRIHTGTSGWHYGHWSGPFYPPGLPRARFLEHYAGLFHTVEINSSFYRLPAAETLEGWRDAVPKDFIFSVKASRLITHRKKLKDPGATLPLFFERIASLGRKLGPVLFQLPPRWNLNLGRLDEFLSALPAGFRYAFEFRDRSWFDEKVYGLLRGRNAAFCIYDLDGAISPLEITADFAYIRLHGPDGPYRGRYSGKTLLRWKEIFSAWLRDGVGEVYCYFDNDEAGYAALNAMELSKMVGQHGGRTGMHGF